MDSKIHATGFDPAGLRSEAKRRAYWDRVKAQTHAWAEGAPFHNRVDDECCPDFSCCQPALLETDSAKRWGYYRERYGLNS